MKTIEIKSWGCVSKDCGYGRTDFKPTQENMDKHYKAAAIKGMAPTKDKNMWLNIKANQCYTCGLENGLEKISYPDPLNRKKTQVTYLEESDVDNLVKLEDEVHGYRLMQSEMADKYDEKSDKKGNNRKKRLTFTDVQKTKLKKEIRAKIAEMEALRDK